VFFAESQWAIDALQPIAERLTSAIDAGAGSIRYRGRAQNRSVYDFLRARNVRLTTLDSNPASACDVCADITKASTMPPYVATYDLVLCMSVLEHVADVHAAAATLLGLTNRGGYLLITAPRRYPHHRAPIDTGYRPTNRQLETLFPGLTVLRSEIICPPRDKWFHWIIFPPALSVPLVSCVLLQKGSRQCHAS
jgi:SAM-dependent methyltransferase